MPGGASLLRCVTHLGQTWAPCVPDTNRRTTKPQSDFEGSIGGWTIVDLTLRVRPLPHAPREVYYGVLDLLPGRTGVIAQATTGPGPRLDDIATPPEWHRTGPVVAARGSNGRLPRCRPRPGCPAGSSARASPPACP